MSDGTIYVSKQDTSKTYVQKGETFIERFMTDQDYVMESWGMAAYAGVYTPAVKLISINEGSSKTVKISELHEFYTKI